MEKVVAFFKTVWSFIVKIAKIVYKFVLNLYKDLASKWPLENKIHLWIVLLAVLVLIIIIIIIIANRPKRKVVFYDGKKKLAKVKVKHKKEIPFPQTDKAGYVFVAWYKDKKFKKPYAFTTLKKRKKLKLYAKYEPATEVEEVQEASPVEEVQPQVETPVETPVEAPVCEVTQNTQMECCQAENGVIEEKIETVEEVSVATFYDDIRYELLSYERAVPFKKIGVQRKQVIAEMFEKDGKICLYLAASPKLMKEKGFNVAEYTEPEFSIVPCKKVVETYEEYKEAIGLIKEVMLLNNLVKSEVVLARRSVSDEQTRKNGFAFYVKNDYVATSAVDYYKLLRATVLSYSISLSRKFPEHFNNKMILKIFKKGEKVFIYLALNPPH